MQDAGPEFPMLSGLLLNAIAAAPERRAHPGRDLDRAVARRPAHSAHRHEPRPAPGGRHGHRPHRGPAGAHRFTIPEIARAAGISHNHLTRLFRAETGTTVVAYIRRRRLQRAHHLLRATTLSIHGGRRLRRHPRPAGLQQGVPPRTRRLAPRTARNYFLTALRRTTNFASLATSSLLPKRRRGFRW